jgi:hypothetical protein
MGEEGGDDWEVLGHLAKPYEMRNARHGGHPEDDGFDLAFLLFCENCY